MSAHENLEHAEHAEHASHGGNKKIALLISVLALFLAFSETLGKSAQTAAITDNVAANDLWAFFQAKNIRVTILRTGARALADRGRSRHRSGRQGPLPRPINDWQKTAARYDDEPEAQRRPQAALPRRQAGRA